MNFKPTLPTNIPPYLFYFVVAIPLALGIYLRLHNLDNGLWNDEIYSVMNWIQKGPHSIFTDYHAPNNHQLYNLLAWMGVQLFGEGDSIYRLPSVLSSICCLVLCIKLFRRYGYVSALVAISLLALHPYYVDISRQVRGYGLAIFLQILALESGIRYLNSQKKLWLILAFFCSVCLIWTLPFLAVYVFPFAIVLLILSDHKKFCFAIAVLSFFVCVIWFIPILQQILAYAHSDISKAFASEFSNRTIANWIFYFFLSHVPSSSTYWDGWYFKIDINTLPPFRIPAASIWQKWYFSQNPDHLIYGAGIIFLTMILFLVRFKNLRSHLALCVFPAFFSVSILYFSQVHLPHRGLVFLLIPCLWVLCLFLQKLYNILTAQHKLWHIFSIPLLGSLYLFAICYGFQESMSHYVALPIENYKHAAQIINEKKNHDLVFTNMYAPRNLKFYSDKPINTGGVAEAFETIKNYPNKNIIFVNYSVAVPREKLVTREFLKYFHSGEKIHQGGRTGSIRLYGDFSIFFRHGSR